MKQGVETSEQSRNTEDPYELRLMSLLQDLVKEKGRRGAAKALGVDHRTVAASIEEGRLSKRVRGALEFALLTGADPETARHKGRIEALEKRMASLEAAVNAGHAELRRALEDGIAGLREDYAQAIGLIEKRLAVLETRSEAQVTSKETVDVADKPALRPSRRVYRELVTLEPEPGEEQVYGAALPLIVEWRHVRSGFLAGGGAMKKAQAEARLRELEIALIDEYGMTLPPATHPWDQFQKRDELQRRVKAMEESQLEWGRLQLMQRLLRFLTFGLWRPFV